MEYFSSQSQQCDFIFNMDSLHAREPLYSKGAVKAWWLQSTSAQNSVPSCLKEKYFGQYFTSVNIHCKFLSLINPAIFLCNTFLVG